MSLELEKILGIERYTQLQDEFIPGPTGPKGESGTGPDGSFQIVLSDFVTGTHSGGGGFTITSHDVQPNTLTRYKDSFLVVGSSAGDVGPGIGNYGIAYVWENSLGAQSTMITQFLAATPMMFAFEMRSHPTNTNIIQVATIGTGASACSIDVGEDWISIGGKVQIAISQGVNASYKSFGRSALFIVKGTSI